MGVRLIPERVILESSDKFFSKTGGRSSGSGERIEFRVDGDEPANGALARAILLARRKMDDRILTSEYLRGALAREEYLERRVSLQGRYEKALGKLDTVETVAGHE